MADAVLAQDFSSPIIRSPIEFVLNTALRRGHAASGGAALGL